MVRGRPAGGGVRIRRATRHDLPALRALLGATGERNDRFDRRLLRSLAAVVYVAEDAAGVVGAVACAFVPSLAASRWCTVLDGAWVAGERPALLDALVAFAEERGRQRASAAMLVAAPVAGPLADVLAARGYRPGERWSLALPPSRGPSGRS